MTYHNVVINLCVSYCVAILILIVRLIHIHFKPEYYEDIRGYSRYEKSGFFWPKGLAYKKTDPPGFALPTFSVLYFFVIDLWMVFTHKLVAAETGSWCMTFYCVHPILNVFYLMYPFVLATVFMIYFTICSPLPWDICVTLHRMHYTRRANLHKRWVTIFLITLISGGVVQFLVLNNAGYVTEEELVYWHFVPYQKQVYHYSDCTTEISIQDSEQVTEHYYLVNENGDAFDLCNRKIHLTLQFIETELWEYVDSVINSS